LDSFTYRVRDNLGALSNIATVRVTITPVNDTPEANPESATTPEDTTLNVSAPGVLGNDTGIGDTPLTLAVVSGPTDGGALTLNNNGSYSYTPSLNFNGTSTFDYRVTDADAEWSEATVTITVTAVNDPPVAVNDNPPAFDEDTSTVVNVVANDTDVDGTVDPATVVIVGAAAHLVATPNGDGGDVHACATTADRRLYVPGAGQPGALSNGDGWLAISPVNDPPVANPDNHDGRTTRGYRPGVLGNDTDIDTPALTVGCRACERRRDANRRPSPAPNLIFTA
jgi:VCBS repeat-containing protein